MGVFKSYARYYDLLYEDKEYDLEVSYVDVLIREYSDMHNTVLDLGCGTGRHDVALAERGYKVTGVDRSVDMINLAGQGNGATHPGLSFLQGDVRDMRLKDRFDIVTALFHVMSYQVTDDDAGKMVETARCHLRDSGVFIFDYWHGPAVIAEQPEKRKKVFKSADIEIIRTAVPEMHLGRNIVDVNYHFSVYDSKGSCIENFDEQHRMRYFFPDELQQLCSDFGFEELATSKWMTKEPVSEKSWNAVSIWRKKS